MTMMIGPLLMYTAWAGMRPVAVDLANVVQTTGDLDELARWLDTAVTADSLDAFRATVGR
jgi:hypothetical protein